MTRPRTNLKLKLTTLSSLLVAGVILAGCGGGDDPEPEPGKQSLNLQTFTSPDGNIGCIADDQMVRCDIRKKSWRVERDPQCQLDYGNGLSVGTKGSGEVVCAGDTTLSDGPAVRHGSINMVGPFECESNEWGDTMRCENVHTSHGFELSGDQYELF